MLLLLLLPYAAGLAPVATKPAPVATQQQTALSAPGLVAASNEDLEAVVGGARVLTAVSSDGAEPLSDGSFERIIVSLRRPEAW